MKKKFDQNDFQGRRYEQVQLAYRIVFGCVVTIYLICTWILVYEIIKMIF